MENYDLVGAEYAELNHADFGDLRRRVRKSHIHGDRIWMKKKKKRTNPNSEIERERESLKVLKSYKTFFGFED